MPTKTIYVKDPDLQLFEQAQADLGESISSLFAAFLRERVANLTPVERKIIELKNEIGRKRELLKAEARVPAFVDGEYSEAELYADKALTSLRANQIRNAKTFFYAANTYYGWAERDVKNTRELAEKSGRLLRRFPRQKHDLVAHQTGH